MTEFDIKEYLGNLTSHVMFEYNGYSCGVDPLAHDNFDMWYGDESMTAHSIDEVMTTKFFDGKSLEDILDDITELEYQSMNKSTHPELTPDIHAYIKKWVKENSDQINKNILEKIKKK